MPSSPMQPGRVMKTATYLLAVATFLVAPSLSATQSSAQSDNTSVPTSIHASAGERSPEVQLYIGRGDELSRHLRYDAAARDYARAADIARREGHLASGASWKLASAHFYNGNLVGGALALDQLANEAALVGDLEVEALALYYAAWLDGKAGQKAEMAVRVARVGAGRARPADPLPADVGQHVQRTGRAGALRGAHGRRARTRGRGVSGRSAAGGHGDEPGRDAECRRGCGDAAWWDGCTGAACCAPTPQPEALPTSHASVAYHWHRQTESRRHHARRDE